MPLSDPNILVVFAISLFAYFLYFFLSWFWGGGIHIEIVCGFLCKTICVDSRPASLVVADFGCGDCKIALSVKNKVHSFDLALICDRVTVCDMANVSPTLP